MQDSTMMLMDLIALGCAGYCAYTWLRLRKEGRLFQNSLLVPKDRKAAECRDEAGYVSYLLPRLGVLSLLLVIISVFMTVNDLMQTPLLSARLSVIPLAVIFVILVWYAVASARAFRNYFE